MHVFHYIKNLRANSSEPENLRTLLALYWRALLTCAGILMIAILTYGGWQIFSVMSDNAIAQQDTPAQSPQSAPINIAQVDAVLHGFTQRQTRFEALKTSSTSIADPSQ